jgi:Tol biopolymer transport system component
MKKLSVFSLIFSFLFILSCEDKKDTTPPTVSIQSPVSGSKIGELVTIKVSTKDNDGILKVEFFIDNKNVLTDTESPYEYEWDTTKETDGDHTIKVNSYDLSENMTESQPVLVKIDNESLLPNQINIESVSYDLNKMTVRWSESMDTDFMEYNLHYSDSENGTKTLIRTITDKTVSLFDTTTFDPTKENWYFLEVVDSFGLKKIGNGKTNKIDSPPTKSTLKEISYDTGNGGFNIIWEQNTDNDFSSYVLYESITGDSTNMSKIYSSNNIIDTVFIVTNVGYDEIRSYKILVKDKWGLESSSSIKSGSYMKIIYSSSRTSNKGEIFINNVKGDNPVNLTNTSTLNVPSDDNHDYNPIFSPNGNEIIFVSERDEDREIYKMNIDGTGLVNITNYSIGSYNSKYHDFNPVFSPNGEKICFITLRNNGDYEIYIMNSDGSGQTNLTNTIGKDTEPIFTPDGQKIVFVSERDGNSEIYIMNSDGSGQTNLTNNPSYDRLYDNNNVNPVITPDGKNIVYNSDMDIYIMGIDGNNPRNLTNSSGNDFYQQVSPDGNYIVFQSSRNGNTEVYIMGIDGNNIKNISNGFGYYPTIDNKSERIIFTGDDRQLYLVKNDGSGKFKITLDVNWDKKNPLYRPFPK